MPYYLVFFLSTSLIGLANAKSVHIYKGFRVFLVILAILTLAVMSGIRSYSVGTDTVSYNGFFNYVANSFSFTQYCNALHSNNGLEYGYIILNYIVGKIYLSPHFLYFVCQCISGTLIYLSLYKMRGYLDITLGWLTYCCLFYTTSFNILRQTMSLAFILLATVYAVEAQYRKSVILIAVGYLFHTSAIFALVIPLTGKLIKDAADKKQLKRRIIFLTLLIIFTPQIINLANSIGLFSDKYSQYLGQDTTTNLITTMGVRLPMIIGLVYSWYHDKWDLDRNIMFIYLITIFEFLMLPLQSITAAAGRLMLSLGITKVISYPLIIAHLHIKPSLLRNCITILFIFLIVGIFYAQVIVQHNNQVYPYVIDKSITW